MEDAYAGDAEHEQRPDLGSETGPASLDHGWFRGFERVGVMFGFDHRSSACSTGSTTRDTRPSGPPTPRTGELCGRANSISIHASGPLPAPGGLARISSGSWDEEGFGGQVA
jgi:hypothetical protein